MSRRAAASVRWATGLYRRATRLLPREFRAAYRDELVDCFAQIAADGRRRGRAAVLAIALWSILDLLRSAPKQHLAAARAGLLDPGGVWVGSWSDVRQAVRRLLRQPAFSLTAVATLGLGLAAATAVFTLVHGVLIRPLPYPQAERIVDLDHGGAGLGIDRGLGVTHGFYRFYAERVHSLEVAGTASGVHSATSRSGKANRAGMIPTISCATPSRCTTRPRTAPSPPRRRVELPVGRPPRPGGHRRRRAAGADRPAAPAAPTIRSG
ncbi:MAG TPA: hypothetical protein VMT16_08015 [Thermoanaerobaculia bacterium]|nr:hypothetical protein [Thermoanaerobaculia bacterium]